MFSQRTPSYCQKFSNEKKLHDIQKIILTLSPPIPTPGETWQHYKGGKYLVIGAVINEASQDVSITYTSTATTEQLSLPWSRKHSDWFEKVKVGETYVPRFKPYLPKDISMTHQKSFPSGRLFTYRGKLK